MTSKKIEIPEGIQIGPLTIDPVTGDIYTTGNVIVQSPGQFITNAPPPVSGGE